MSLVIREKSQPVLDEYGFSMLHAAMKLQHGSPNYMVLRTVCGKEVALVHGVEFSKSNPTVSEVDFAVSLLRDWVERNKNAMEEYLLKWAELDNTKAPPVERDEMRFRSSYGSTHVQVENEHGVVFQLSEEGLRKAEFDKPLKGDWYSQLKLPAAGQKAAVAFLNEHLTYRQMKQNVEKLRGELISCNPHR